MTKKAIPFALWIVSCGGETKGAFPSGSTDESEEHAGENADDNSPTNACGEAWSTDDDGVSTQPNSCLKWSIQSEDKMNWYDAASLSEGLSGNCGNHCPEDEHGYCSRESFGFIYFCLT